MFNFHKPRTYRSTEGCCICKAKSSSSRFTDSRKYERDTMQCFDLKYPRQGEICNACVLLVKRFKRLPVGSKRNWSHIVDAKAGIGPGYNKIQTKYKSERINSRAAAAAAALQQQVGASTSHSNNASVNCSAVNGLTYIPEKFSKIFKKSKKLKDSSATNMKRKSNHNNWSQSNTQSLPTTPDSLDSDYEDSRHHPHQLNLSSPSAGATGAGGSGSIVQFQTQTRASAYKAQAAAEARKRIIKLGTKRRKCLPPRKFRRTLAHEESVEFFDEEEWQERKSCCGMLYECPALGGALIIDADTYKPCEQHQQQSARLLNLAGTANTTTSSANNDNKHSPVALIQKSIIQTVPAVVQLQPPTVTPTAPTSTPPVSVSYSSNSSNLNNNNFKTVTSTPVLKKHHLFFKRQSECFPQGDLVTANSNNNNNNDNNHHHNQTPAHVVNIIKTESEFNVPQQQQQQQQQQNSTTNSTTIQRHIENAIHSTPNTIITTNPLTTSSSASLSISVTSSSSSTTTMPQMPKHSLAKVTTISPPLTSTTTTTLHQHQHQHHLTAANLKPNTFLHKIKADTSSSSAGGKVVKHSLEKFNTAVRLKTSDIHEMKPIIRTVDKSYILAKPPTHANIITLNANTTTQATTTYQSLASYNAAAQPPLTTASLSAASPTSSTSSTSSTKFSDNSSDSGFDENMLDRKSASPLQEDCEKKILSRPGVQTMFLASGVQIQGQPQNLVLTGNEVAAKILQSRKYSSITANPISSNSRSHHPATTAVKIAQISTTSSSSSVTSGGGPPTSTMSSASQAKMRAIYNNNNMIQHENGITTIVPASSLAATTQTAAMQNIAPSTVTITPAPPVGTQFNTQNVISRKLTAANIINLQSNTTSNSHNNQHHHLHQQQQQHHQHHHHHQQQQHHLSSSNNNHHQQHNSTTNQKIILLKTSPNNTTTVTATATNYNTLSGGGGGGGHHGNNGGGGR